jgi:uncharacterized protein (TIGR02646 family)
MKVITKTNEPVSLTTWKNLATNDWVPSYSVLQNPEKLELHERLLNDQGNICCYCEQRVLPDTSHIEHFSPQSLGLICDLEYGNLLASCGRETKRGDPEHCGIKKGNVDSDTIISPLDPGCEQSIIFKHDGRVSGTNDLSSNTVSVLALDISKLNNLRSSAIEPFIELEPEDLTVFVNSYLERNTDGTFEPFWTTIRQLFN